MNPPPPDVLPSRYYLGHFLEMLDFVASRYDHALDAAHRSFLGDFGRLSEEARCLYVRIANRRGRIFRRDQLRYEEITDPETASAELIGADFLRSPESRDLGRMLATESRNELLARLRAHFQNENEAPPRLASMKKAALLKLATTTLPFEVAYPDSRRTEYLVQRREDEVAYLLFLYFGSLDRDLTSFALRDLGRVRTAAFRDDFEARFTSRDAAWACFFHAKTLQSLEEAEPESLRRLSASVEEWPDCREPEAELLRHRALHRLGRLLERDGQGDAALAVYSRSDQYPATERRVRLLHQGGRVEEAEELLRRLIDDPSCDGELLFAEDFLERKFQKKRTGKLTELLRSGPVLPLDESGRGHPELTAARRIARDGATAAHVENRPWQQLFGLLFWDLLYGAEHASLHDPFDFTPQDLSAGTFLDRHCERIEERLRLLDDPEEALALLLSNWETHRGTPNAFVWWDEVLFVLVCQLVSQSPKGALASILGEMARDFRHNRSGFPDLVVFEEEGAVPRFVEIKTEGDQIRRQQLVQIERLRRAGFPVEVARVRWIVDPDQDYVVVDLETTGGDPSFQRITEIGAVRVRNGRIIDEWSSLVNPGRRIPSFIARLTGISDEMVAQAPPFADIAADLRDYLGDAVFVAHRAKFDHGFLKAEFGRLGEDFGGPILCTVVESRRHFPGLPSYGLGSLCAHFGIPLDSHHRALCDARATAELLIRINEKRVKASASETGEIRGEPSIRD